MSDARTAVVPRAVGLAVGLLLALAALGLLRLVLTLVWYEQLVDAYVGGGPAAPQQHLREVVARGAPAFRGTAVIFGVGFGALVAAAAFGVRARKRWARVVGIIAAALMALGGIGAVLLQHAPPWFLVLGVVTAVVAIAAIVALLLPGTRNAINAPAR